MEPHPSREGTGVGTGETEEEIQRALQETPDHLALKARLADLYRRQDRLDEARILSEEILVGDPQHPQALCILGDIFLQQRSPRKALECYRQANNRDPRPYLNLRAARALKVMENYPEALQELEKVLVIQRQNIPFLKEKALILNRMKRFEEALDSYERIQEMQPDDPFVRKEILRLRSRTRPRDQVLKELQTIVGMPSKKGDAQVRGLLAQKLKDAGMIREAAAEYAAASTLEPANLYFLKQQGFCHYQLKKYDEAVKCLADAFRKDPADYVVRKTLQKCYETQGNLKEFLDLLEETFGHHPHNKPLLGTIKKVRDQLNQKASGDS